MKRSIIDTLVTSIYEKVDLCDLEKKIKQAKKSHKDILLEFKLDYGSCYYEGDCPDIAVSLTGVKK